MTIIRDCILIFLLLFISFVLVDIKRNTREGANDLTMLHYDMHLLRAERDVDAGIAGKQLDEIGWNIYIIRRTR